MSSKAGTQYSETERLVTLTQLERFNLNPHAFFGLMESYILNCHPMPLHYVHKINTPDFIMDAKAGNVGEIELDIRAVGNLSSKRWANPEQLDPVFLRLFLQSYYHGVRPLPVDFQFANAISIHIRTPGISDSENKKNPLRNLWDPFKKASSKKKR